MSSAAQPTDVTPGGASVGVPAPPAPTRPSIAHLVVLAALVVIAIVRGLLWVGLGHAPSPVDELAHLGYVDHLATGKGVPVVGQDPVPSWVLELDKLGNPLVRPLPVSTDPESDLWGLRAIQYEGHQGPVAYALLAPVLAVVGSDLPVVAFSLLRLAMVLIASLGVVVAWLLARELVPTRPRGWLIAALVPAAALGVNADTASVTNDAAAIVVTGLALVPIARTARTRRWGPASAIATGTGLAAALLTKPNAAIVVILGALAAFGAVATGRISLRRALSWGLGVGAVAVGPVIAWLAWQLATYGGTTAASVVVELVVEVIQPSTPLSPTTLGEHSRANLSGFWTAQTPIFRWASAYSTAWWSATGLAIAGALGVLCARAAGRASEAQAAIAAGALWGLAALPAAQLVHIVLVYTAGGGGSITGGRLLYTAVVPLAAGLGAAAALLPPRRAAATLGVLLVVTAGIEHRAVTASVLVLSTPPAVSDGELAWIQDRADGIVSPPALLVEPPCPVTAAGLWLVPEDGVVELGVETLGGVTSTAQLEIEQDRAAAQPSVFRLAEPLDEPFVLDLPDGTSVGATSGDTADVVSIVGVDDRPSARLWCTPGTVADPRQVWIDEYLAWRDPIGLSADQLRMIPASWTLLWTMTAAALATSLALPAVASASPSRSQPVRRPRS